MDCSTLGFPVHHQLPELLKLMSIKSVIPYNHLILCRPLFLLPSVFTSIMVFSNEPVLCIRWPKYWSFSLSISPSNEYSGLISFRMDWFDLLTVQGTLENLFQYHSSKASILWCSKIFVYGICILQFYWIFKLVLTVFFLMESLELSIHKIMSSTNVTMYKCTSFLIWMCLISFSCLIAVARTSNIMMNTSSKWVLGSEIPPGCGSLCQGWGLWWNCLRLPYLLCLMCNYHSARLQVFLKEEMVHMKLKTQFSMREGEFSIFLHWHLLKNLNWGLIPRDLDSERFILSEHSVENRLVRDADWRRRLGLRRLCRGGDNGSDAESISKGESSIHWWIFGSWI